MCIIIAKPEDVKLPDFKTLETCWNNNPHGAGFCFPDKDSGKVVISKGYESLVPFYDDLKEAENLPLVIHFRIATSGFVNKEQTHPFPIINSKAELDSIYTHTTWSFAHNGILLMEDKTTHMSDSQVFVRDILSHVIDPFKLEIHNSAGSILDLVAKESHSKFALMNREGKIFMYGGFEKVAGSFYSNNTYKEDKWDYTKYLKGWYADKEDKEEHSFDMICSTCSRYYDEKSADQNNYVCQFCGEWLDSFN